MAASDMRNRRHVQLLLTWSTNTAHPVIPGLGALTGPNNTNNSQTYKSVCIMPYPPNSVTIAQGIRKYGIMKGGQARKLEKTRIKDTHPHRRFTLISEINDNIKNMPRRSRPLIGRNTAASRRYRNAIAIEPPLQSETCRALRRLRYSEARVAAAKTMQVPVQRIQLWTHKPFSGLQYNTHIDYTADSSVDIGQMSRVCQFCSALRFRDEPFGLCCKQAHATKNIFTEFLNENDIDIALVSETWIKPCHRLKIQNINTIRQDRHKEEEQKSLSI
ncbi:hypothetical protein LAZ67_19002744 [Cordylochernes scorpioides]|uniref:Uncharacterized protein n=1 Tax=Cordylochernes scorpioides TaxID=51811 RepID=A0ABY6LMK6_9ARAC|nr:hypothetical protein LAZ67_19002744 [Cordylochernes scorpioides]